MSKSVKSIFMVLITIVVCVAIGAAVLRVLVPNVYSSMINATEDMIFKGTGMSFDWNNDSDAGGTNNNNNYTGSNNSNTDDVTVDVEGFN